MANVSPGIYSKIIDLSEYVRSVPSTIGFIPAITEKGEDNKLLFLGARSELISGFGEPNISLYGKNYGQGQYCAYNFLGESGALYFMRCLPDDATYANLKINAVAHDTTATITLAYVSSADTLADIKTELATSGHTYPICILRPVGRGEYGNAISVRFTAHSNPLLNGVYVLDIYEKQSDATEMIVESFEVSFDPNARSLNGDSIWISYILNTYSTLLKCEMTKASGDYSDGYTYATKVYDKEIGDVSVDLTAATATITDTKQNFEDWEDSDETGLATYMVIAKDGVGNRIYGWLGAADSNGDTVNVFTENTMGSRGWSGETSSFRATTTITYEIKKTIVEITEAFASATPVPLKKGSDGTLKNADGSINTSVATNVLTSAYAGTLTDPVSGQEEDSVLDTENVYFSLVFDCGYPDSVKTQVSTLVQTRRDCVALMDNGDNATYTASIAARNDVHTFNNYYCSLYEPYNKVYDVFTGQDIWVSPIYHLSYLAPRNDNVGEIWTAIGGFNRASIDSIKELRFNPKLGQRDQMYLKQLNPIVKFAEGYAVWGQLTSQAKASAMQDLNIVRLILYVKRAFEQFCRYFIYEQNDALTWGRVSNQMVLFLEDVKRKRGLDSYTISVGATDYERKTKKFHCDVMLEPTRTVEQINLNFYIQ